MTKVPIVSGLLQRSSICVNVKGKMLAKRNANETNFNNTAMNLKYLLKVQMGLIINLKFRNLLKLKEFMIHLDHIYYK